MSRGIALAVTGLALALSGCGSRGELAPPAGQSLPVAPYGRVDRPMSAELLMRPVQAAPERNVELRRRSEEREDDPFDLPPDEIRPGRGAEPAVAPTAPGDCPEVAGQAPATRLASCRSDPAPAAAG